MVDSGGRPEKGKSGPRVINIIIEGNCKIQSRFKEKIG